MNDESIAINKSSRKDWNTGNLLKNAISGATVAGADAFFHFNKKRKNENN